MTTSKQSGPPIQSLTGFRLRKHPDYQAAYSRSRKHQSASMSWFLAPRPVSPTGADAEAFSAETSSGIPGPRVGLTAGKVLGKAHERNRIKRRMREALRRHADLLPHGESLTADLILHPRRTVLTMDFAKLEAEIVRILNQARAELIRAETQARAELARAEAQARAGQARTDAQAHKQA